MNTRAVDRGSEFTIDTPAIMPEGSLIYPPRIDSLIIILIRSLGRKQHERIIHKHLSEIGEWRIQRARFLRVYSGNLRIPRSYLATRDFIRDSLSFRFRDS